MIESGKVRLVRCPKCKHILPELPDADVYVCGGCGAALQGRKSRKSGADTSSETSNEERVERVSLKSGNLLENERKNFSNSGDISDADVKSNASSLNNGKRGSGSENSPDHSKDRADKWVVETALDMNTNRDELGSIKMEMETGELKPHVQNASTSWRSERSSGSRFGERGEREGFRRNPRADVGGGMRYSYSTYPDEGPSDYGYGEPLIRNRRMDAGGDMRHSYSTSPVKGPSNYGYDEPLRNGGSSLDGGDRVEHFGHDQTRLVRQLNELKDRFNRSCDITEKPQEKVPLDRRKFHEEAYEDSEAWFPASSSSSRRSSMPYFMPDKPVSEPPYPKQYADPFPYNTRHEKGMHRSYPSIHDSNHIPGYEDGFGPQMLRQRRSPGHYRHRPPPAYFPGGYMEPDNHPYEPYPRNPNLHHPSCSCFHCYTRRQEVPGSIPPNAFLNRRFPDIPNDPMLYHHQENPVAFGPRVYNPPMRTSHDSHFHTRMTSDLNSQTSDFARHLPPKEDLLKGRRYFRPLAGGAPFITCCNCIEVLRLPKKILLAKKNQQKIRCGACSTIIFLAVDHDKIVASIHEETEKTSKEIDDGTKQLVDERPRPPSNSLGQVNNQYSENFSSDDYDQSAYDFQSMDAEAGSVQTEQALNSRKPERVQNLNSSPSTPKNEGSREGLIAPGVEDNLLEQPKKVALSPPPPGSTLQDHFDYSSNNFELNHFWNGDQSRHSDHEKAISPKAVSRQSSVKDVSMATEMEVSFNEFSNTGVSLDSGDASREHEDLRINKRGERFLDGIVRKDFRDSSSPTPTTEQGRNIVMVNGHLIPDHLVKKAEKLAGTIQPGDYWYDFYAGFWGVMGGRCLGIIPPFIEEFKYPMPEDCAAGNTGVYVNGRELNQKDLDLLASRGLPPTRDRDYTIDMSGSVQDRDTGEELESLGKLAPTVERMKRGFGMKTPRSAA